MGSRSTDIDDHSTMDTTPEDVAALYSWAKLQGAKYRDYSGSRRELRAQVRYRAAKAALERELNAQAEAEAAAEKAEREARAAEAIALSGDAAGQTARAESLRNAERAALNAAAERVEAARRAEAAARATILALQEEREIAEARVSAQQQAMIYAEVEMRRRELAGPQPHFPADSEGSATPFPMHLANETDQAEERRVSESNDQVEREPAGNGPDATNSLWERRGEFAGQDFEAELESARPAWLTTTEFAKLSPAQPISASTTVEVTRADSLQDYRERVAARWFALKGIFEQAGDELPPAPARSPGELRMPLLAVFSIVGGVGKTSLVATLGRALASAGEKVTLVDATCHGLLPFYYGARDLRPGELRTFAQRQDLREPVSMVVCEPPALEQQGHHDALTQQILRYAAGRNQRVLLDLTAGASWLLQQIVELHPTLLVPIAPDMNSVISVQTIEGLLRGITDSEGRALVPFYVLNQFDAAQPLHLDIREVFRRMLGRRLLHSTVRESSAVSEALAEGMTVVDYAPSDPITRDYVDIASWLREYSPLKAESPGLRWGEK